MTDEPRHEESTTAHNDGNKTAADIAELQRGFNDLRHKVLEGREKLVDWWLKANAIFLTLVSIVAVVAGYIGFQTFREIETEARKNMVLFKQHAEEASSLVNEIKRNHEESESIVAGLNAAAVGKDPDKASEAAKSVQENPTASPIHQAIAVAVLLQQQGKNEESLEKWRSIANIAQGTTDKELEAQAWFSVGYLYGEIKDFKKAIEAYDAALRLNPNLAEAYNNRGNAKNSLGEHEAAIEDYNEALQRNPDDAEVYNNRGNAKGNIGEHEAAIKDYNEALRLNPNLAEAYNNRGVVKSDLGEHKAAIEDYNEALRLMPDDAEVYSNRSVVNVQLGRRDEARRDLQKALDLARKAGREKFAANIEQNIRKLE